MPHHDIPGRHERLARAIGLLDSASGRDDATAILRDHARAIADADGITVVLREGMEVFYAAEDAISPLWTGQRFPVERCISGLAIMAGEPILIPDIRNDPRVPLNAYLATFVASMAAFPIGRTAALGAYWRHPGAVDLEAVGLMTRLAAAAARIFDPSAPPARKAG